jgi:pimeloyl-ACP methyl ester carboxylesterase
MEEPPDKNVRLVDIPNQTLGLAPSIVFVHGMRTSGAIWDAQLAAVRDAGYDARAIDLPGHGVRLHERFTMQGAFAAIDEAADEMAASRPGAPLALVGLSLGGYTSLAYAAQGAARHGGRLRGIVAASCSTDTHGLPLRAFQGALSGSLAAGRLTRDLATRTAALAGRLVLPPVLRRTVPGAARPTRSALPVAPPPQLPGWDLVSDALRYLAGESSVRNLRGAHVPVWLVNGARDQLRMQERRHARAASRLVVLPGAGHDVSLEAPDAFNATVLEAMAAFGRV